MIWPAIQRLVAAVSLLLVSPLLAVLALAIRMTSRGPALHRATRVGGGRTFTLYKLRTMRSGAAEAGPGITAADDPRVTGLGRFLRRTKLDELPQLWNVARGEMLLVGPRPEDPRFVDWTDERHRLVFSARPGITGAASLDFRHEEAILTEEAAAVARELGDPAVNSTHTERAYRERILPAKLALEAAYLRDRSVRGDLAIIGRTIGGVLRRTGPA